MFTWILWSACALVATTPEGGVRTDHGDSVVVEYAPDHGIACVDGPASGGTTVLVDFGDCFFCSTDSTLWCEATLSDDTTIVVHGGGNVLIEADCSTGGTCEPTVAECNGPDLEPGDYTLSYRGVEVPVTLPAGTWTCTGPSAIL